MNKTKEFLQTFFEEKDIEKKYFEVEGELGINIIPNKVVIEHILVQPELEQEKIAEVLRKIDFLNGDVNHFLEHLAKSLAK